MSGFGLEIRKGKTGAQRHRGTRNGQSPQETAGTWAQTKGSKGEDIKPQERRQIQARGARQRDERQRLTGGGCGRRLCGWHFAPREEVESGFK